jgi:hypothetical protein
MPEPPAAAVAPHRDVPPLPSSVDWRSALPKAVAIALFSVLFMNLAARISIALGFLSMALIGALVVLLYARSKTAPMTVMTGLKIGIVAGFIAWIAHGGLALTVFLMRRDLILQDIRTALDRSSAAATPESRQILERLLSSPEGPATLMVMALIMLFLMLVGMSAAGGAITAAAMRSNQPR